MPDRILLVSPASPLTPQSGAQQRTALLYEALQRRGDVDVLLLEPTRDATRLQQPAPGVLAHGFWRQAPLGAGKFNPDPELNRALADAGVDLGRYSLIVGRYLSPIAKLMIPPGVRTVVDLDDWGYHYANDTLALGGRLKSLYAYWLARRQLDRFDGYFFVSWRDQRRHPEPRSAILPNIPFRPPARPFPQIDSSSLLFVGSLWYRPNREGIDRFLARCWPMIKAARADATLLLAGPAPLAVRQTWSQRPGVSAPGFVDDLGDAYRRAAFSIAPIYSGGGSNIKILESLAYGRACVTTPYCAAAFEAELANAGLGVAVDDRNFAHLCIDWLDSIGTRASKAEEGFAQLARHFTRPLFIERALQFCASVCDESAATAATPN